MWWEIIPSAGIMFVVFHLPSLLNGQVNKLLHNTPYRRTMSDVRPWEWQMYQRDRSVSHSTIFSRLHGQKVSDGHPYYSYGLEAIPDKKQQE